MSDDVWPQEAPYDAFGSRVWGADDAEMMFEMLQDARPFSPTGVEVERLRAQVAELLPWAMYGARKVGEFGDDVVGTIEIANGKVCPLIRPSANDLIRRIHTGEFWGDA